MGRWTVLLLGAIVLPAFLLSQGVAHQGHDTEDESSKENKSPENFKGHDTEDESSKENKSPENFKKSGQKSPSKHPVTSVDSDPHFIIEVEDQNDTFCFNIDDVPGTIFNLVNDPVSGIVVNGQTIGDKKVDPGSKVYTYFGRFGIAHQKLNLTVEVTTQSITVSQDRGKTLLSWSDNRIFRGPGMEIEITKDRSLSVSMSDSAKFLIILHRVWKNHPYNQDYLGFYTVDSHLLSSKVHGLLGQFYHGLQFKVDELHAGKDADRPDATMIVKGLQLNVTRGWRKDFRRDVKYGEGVPCWFVHNNGMGLIDGTHHDYVVSDLFKTVDLFKTSSVTTPSAKL